MTAGAVRRGRGQCIEGNVVALASSYSKFEDELLVAAYLFADESGADNFRLREITEKFEIGRKPGWVRRALQSFIDSGYSSDWRHLGGDELDQTIALTPRGFKRGEELSHYVNLADSGLSIDTDDQVGLSNASSENDVAPASDRIVKFDHNLPDFSEIQNGLSQTHEDVRASNDIEPDERDRILQSLDAASSLWKAAELKIVQIKIGVLMAVEDAAKALATTTKAVAAALLVDAIKSFVKTHAGVDLDNL